MIAIRIKVTGRVQGVFFRVSTKERADELGIKGWVKNELDGSVLIEAEGKEDQLNEFKQWCTIGPPSAGVEGISVEEIALSRFSSFEVIY